MRAENRKGILDLLNNYKKEREYQKGIEMLKEILNSQDDKTYLEYMGEFYYLSGNYKDAELYANKVLSLEPDNFYGLLLKAKILMKRKKIKEALDILLSIENKKSNIEVSTHIGICYLKMKKYENGIEYLKKSIEQNYQSGFVYYYLSNAYFQKGDIDNAIQYIEKAYETNNSEFYYTTLIKYKMEKLSIPERIKELNKILQIKGKKEIADLHAYLAENLLKDKKYNEAVEEFYSALKLKPSNHFYKERYIYVCDKAGKYEITNELLPEVIRKKPFQVWLQVLYTRSCIKLNRIESGLEFFYSLIKNNPNNNSIGKQIKKLKQFLPDKNNEN